ncbi:MAG: phosphoribosylamine--glycine ligase [Bacteroidetes bacterium]|nr:phosphoribosylamine--glycine ligase [Bacteroidota bacterium]
MNVLILGSGGREHALAWKVAQSPLCQKLFIAPGNPGTATLGTNLPIAVSDFPAIRTACTEHQIRLVLVGPEDPLVNGLTDFLEAADELPGLLVIGPSQQGAQLEGSKAFAKSFMIRHGIPTAAYREFTSENFDAGLHYLSDHPLPIVLKADGLAAGKGVVIATDHAQAIRTFTEMIREAKFGAAGSKVVIEQFLQGIEMSVFVLTNGEEYLLLPAAKDYKRIGEGDTGLNTGGMGAVSPVPFATPGLMRTIEEEIVRPTIRGLKQENIRYRGFVFIGLMVDGNRPYVIEYNCRMGDPETEVVMPRLRSDLLELLIATGKGELNRKNLETDPRAAATVVAVSGGYPESYHKGFPITGTEEVDPDCLLFHMGTGSQNGQLVTQGGRVLSLTAFGDTIAGAVARAQSEQAKIHYEGKYLRRDIGHEFPEL